MYFRAFPYPYKFGVPEMLLCVRFVYFATMSDTNILSNMTLSKGSEPVLLIFHKYQISINIIYNKMWPSKGEGTKNATSIWSYMLPHPRQEQHNQNGTLKSDSEVHMMGQSPMLAYPTMQAKTGGNRN